MIYLDHAAASEPLPEVREAMREALSTAWANPSSVHAEGRRARALLERARGQVAAAAGADPAQVVLTSGGTEAVALALRSLARGARRVVTTTVEHPSVAEEVARLRAEGLQVVRLAVPRGAPPPLEEVEALLGPDVLLACQWINHETGTVLPVERWAASARARGGRVFVDATQALGKRPLPARALGADALALASSKIGGPAGAGALVVRREVAVEPLFLGGPQERGRRPGTPGLVALAGFGAACAALPARLEGRPALAPLRDALEEGLVGLGGVVNAPAGPRDVGFVNVSFEGRRADALVAALDVEGLCLSSGAACSSGLSAPSPVILAMHPEAPWRAAAALRASLGAGIDAAAIREALSIFARVLSRAR